MALIEINTDGLAKLGETICYGLGLTASGRKKMADAEAYSVIKETETSMQVEILKLKGEEEIANYVLARESRKINNVKSVVEKATSHFVEGEKVSEEPVNVDWTNRFFGIVEDISDETLHDIWGRILAGEVKNPSSFSLRTLELLRNMTKEEAELFVKASKFYIEGDFICTEGFTLSFQEILLLEETGLIRNSSLVKKWPVRPNSKLEIVIDKNTLFILHNDKNEAINYSMEVKRLSKAGIELLSLIEQPDRSMFYSYLARYFKAAGMSHVFKHEIVEYGNIYKYKILGQELP